MAYRDRLREMNDADLEREWRNRCDAKLRYGACQAMYDDCWFESTNRGMGQAFLEVFIQMKEEWKVEQLAQVARIRATATALAESEAGK